ncbi:MAG: response regulator [Betaproteobacteria bacterium]|nr:response regulator [Betaproteobacteria bacterium]
MDELFHAAPDAVAGRILIVDDDPVVAGMLGISLVAAGHRVVEAYSGEEALAQLERLAGASGQLPDVVILDIELGAGFDGYEACRRLRALDATRDLPVIFLSGHDALDDRLRAYDAGGNDFMSKPFVPDEVLRKVALAIGLKRRHEATAVEKRFSTDTAMTALTTLGESGVTLKFSRGALGCRTQRALAELVIESMHEFGIGCHVQLRAPGETLTLTPHGPASPLEAEIIEKSRMMDRVFSFNNRLIVNYENVSLLVMNMPLADEDLCGRIRDHSAMIAEAAELAVGNVNLRTQAVARAEELRKLADASRQAVETLRSGYREQQMATRLELENMTGAIEGMYVHLGLSDHQEFSISDTVHGAVERILELFDRGSEFDGHFAEIVEGLTKASVCTVSLEDKAPATEGWRL